MVDATNGVGPLGNQQFSTKGIKLSDLKEKNQLLFNYFKQAGFNENSYVYSTDIEKLKEAYDKNDNGKLSKKEAKAIFGDDVSRRDIKRAIKAMDEIALTDLQGEHTYPVKVGEHETEYYTKNNFLLGSVYDDKEQQIKNFYGPEKRLVTQIVQKKNEDGTMTPVSHLMNEYNNDGTILSCEERTFGENESFEVTKMTYLNGDQNKPVTIEHNLNGNKKTTNIEYNTEGKKMRTISVANGQKTEVVYDELERPMKQFEFPVGSDLITTKEFKYNGNETTPSEVTITKPGGAQERVTYEKGKFVSREEIVQLKPEDIKPKEEKVPVTKPTTPKVSVPDDWGRAPKSFRQESGITETKDADAALKALLDAQNLKEADIDVDKFKADLIKYNPSLFDKDGKVKNNAKWDKLDLPNNLKAQYGKTPQLTPEDEVPEYLRRPKDEGIELPKFELPKHDWTPKESEKTPGIEPGNSEPVPEEEVPEYLRRPKEEGIEFPKFELPKHDWTPKESEKTPGIEPGNSEPVPEEEVPEYLRRPKEEGIEFPKFELPKHDWTPKESEKTPGIEPGNSEPVPEEEVPEYLRRPKEEGVEFPKFEIPKHDWN